MSRQMPRELRRSVLLPARVRTASGWSDACILNVSSRGMMIHAKTAPPDGTIELRHNEFAFVLEIVWRNGTRVGVRSTERLPVEDILTVSESACLRLTAERLAGEERRRAPRTADHSRLQGRAMEFAATVAIAVILAVGGFAMVSEAFARPMQTIELALARR